MAAKSKEQHEEQTALERLVDIADAIFERAIKLDGIKLARRDDEAAQTIEETRDDASDKLLNNSINTLQLHIPSSTRRLMNSDASSLF